MAGNACGICSSPERLAIVDRMIRAACQSDQAIADAIAHTPGAGKSREAVSRHRRFHVLAPAKALVAASQKDAEAKAQRQEIATAAAEGDGPRVWLALNAIVADLKAINDRLNKGSEDAAAAGQLAILSSLAGQQLRAVEHRAKLGGLTGFVPAKEQDRGEPVVFRLSINLGNGDEVRIEAPVPERQQVIEHDSLGPLPSWISSLSGPTSEAAEIEDDDE